MGAMYIIFSTSIILYEVRASFRIITRIEKEGHGLRPKSASVINQESILSKLKALVEFRQTHSYSGVRKATTYRVSDETENIDTSRHCYGPFSNWLFFGEKSLYTLFTELCADSSCCACLYEKLDEEEKIHSLNETLDKQAYVSISNDYWKYFKFCTLFINF